MKIRSRLRMTWLLSYISIASVSAAIITPALPSIEHTFALSTGTVEWIVSAFLIGYVMGYLSSNPFIGFLWILGGVFFVTMALLLQFKLKNKEA